ncbi:MAG: hypothetical protein Kow00124_16380 [Anaerolineae bacterium]
MPDHPPSPRSGDEPALGGGLRQAPQGYSHQEPGLGLLDLLRHLLSVYETLDASGHKRALRILRTTTDPRALPIILTLLGSARGELREAALTALSNMQNRRAIPYLLAAAQEDDRSTLLHLVSALGYVGDPVVVPTLLDLLERGASRTQVCLFLSTMPDPRAIPAMLRLSHDPYWGARSDAARVLGSIAAACPAETAPHRPQIIETLLALTADDSPQVRASAAEALADIANPATWLPLLGLLASPDETLNRHTLQALARIGEPRSLPFLFNLLISSAAGPGPADDFPRAHLDDPALLPLLNRARESGGAGPHAVAGALADMAIEHDALAPAIIDGFTAILQHGEWGLEDPVWVSLDRIARADAARLAAPHTLRALLAAADRWPLYSPIRVLPTLGAAAAHLEDAHMRRDLLDAMLNLIAAHDAAEYIVWDAALALGLACRPGGLPDDLRARVQAALLGLLTQAEERNLSVLRVEAARALACIAASEGAQGLAQAMLPHLLAGLHQEVFGPRRAAWEGLACLGEIAIPPLIAALDEPAAHEELPIAAVRALYEMIGLREGQETGAPRAAMQAAMRAAMRRAVPPLIDLLASGGLELRRWTARLLGELGDPRAVKPLIAALAPPPLQTRRAVILALERLGGDLDDRRLREQIAAALAGVLGDDRFGTSGRRDPRISELAAAALERIGTPGALAAVVAWRAEIAQVSGEPGR